MKINRVLRASALTLLVVSAIADARVAFAEDQIKEQGRYLKSQSEFFRKNETIAESQDKIKERKKEIKEAPKIDESPGVGGFETLLAPEDSFTIQGVEKLSTSYTQPDFSIKTRFKLHAREGLWAHGVSFGE